MEEGYRGVHLAYTISRPVGKGVEDFLVVGCVARLGEPAFRSEGIWVDEIGRGVVGGILIDAYTGLDGVRIHGGMGLGEDGLKTTHVPWYPLSADGVALWRNHTCLACQGGRINAIDLGKYSLHVRQL